MDKIWYYFTLAIMATYCVFSDCNKVSKTLFTISATCWWILFIGDVVARIA